MSLATERRAARERALGLLYEAESKGCTTADVLAELPMPPDEFATALVQAVEEHRAEIDGLLERFAEGWSLARMPALDRAALRMGSAELLTRPDVPTGVVLAETVELASRFSTDASGRFVNGLLARIAREVRPDAAAPPLASEAEVVDGDADAAPPVPLVDGLIIDLDGVIRHWDLEHVPQVEARLGLPAGTIMGAAFEPDRLERAMDGRLSFAAWCEEIGAAVAAAHAVDAHDVAEGWASVGWAIDHDVLELVDLVRAAVPVALLSNANSRLEEDLELSGIAGSFDAILSSAELGVAKPAAAAFEAAADRLGVPLDRCLFVDDTVGHVEAARRLGLRAEVFTGVEDLRELLTELQLPV